MCRASAANSGDTGVCAGYSGAVCSTAVAVHGVLYRCRGPPLDGAIRVHVGPACSGGGWATCEQKIAAFKWGAEFFGGLRLDDRSLSAPLRLLRRAITRLADNQTPKVQVGRVELGRIGGALKISGEGLQRRL
jgi:hypothetical protein